MARSFARPLASPVGRPSFRLNNSSRAHAQCVGVNAEHLNGVTCREGDASVRAIIGDRISVERRKVATKRSVMQTVRLAVLELRERG